METQLKKASWILPDERKVAHILGLTLEEYDQLSHSGIREIKDLNGDTLSYYMVVSPLNPDYILAKLKMNRMRMIHFPPDSFLRKDYPIEEAV